MEQRSAATAGRLREFIVAELLDEPFHGQDPLAEGAVDSLGIEQLVEYIEEAFGIELDDDEFTYDNFESLDALASLIDSGP
ncbi:MAG TPA: acyl carrier protein [Solirubrobacterales bacterium]|nr:acyl carrier protein [Solirubrobacterales bacterium]